MFYVIWSLLVLRTLLPNSCVLLLLFSFFLNFCLREKIHFRETSKQPIFVPSISKCSKIILISTLLIELCLVLPDRWPATTARCIPDNTSMICTLISRNVLVLELKSGIQPTRVSVYAIKFHTHHWHNATVKSENSCKSIKAQAGSTKSWTNFNFQT